MALCPDKHENPASFARCRTCGLPLIDLKQEFSLIAERLGRTANLARPKASRVLAGVGSFGVNLVQLHQASLVRSAPGRGLSVLYVDAGATMGNGAAPGTFRLQLGGAASGSATFCGVAEEAAMGDPSLVPLLKNAGLRESDEEQTVFVATALGGGTGSGVTPVLLQNALALNPANRAFVLGMLPSADELFHARLNASYGLSRLVSDGDRGPVAEAIVTVQYDRLKRVRGVGKGGEELKSESVLATTFDMLSTAFSFPNSVKVARLNRAAHTQVLTPCVALGRSMEIFGSLGNVLESAVAFPLAAVSNGEVLSCYLMLRVPQGLAKEFPDDIVGEELGGLIRRHLPAARYSLYVTTYWDDASDRVDACLLLGGEAWRVLHSIPDRLQQFNAESAKVKDWSVFGLSRERVSTMVRTLQEYDARLEEMRRF